MIKHIIVITYILGLISITPGCTSTNSSSEDETSEVSADEGTESAEAASSTENAEAPSVEGEESSTASSGEEASSSGENVASNTLPEDALGDISASPEPAPADPLATTTEPPSDGASSPTDPTLDSAAAGATTSSPEATPTPMSTEASSTIAANSTPETSTDPISSSGGTTTVTDSTSEASTPKVGLQKVPSAPWKQGRKWINAVYFAKPNDTLAGISSKIFGSDKTDELLKINPQFSSRSVRPGDKVYYNSPQRPNDGDTLKTYYEDNNIEPSSYTAKSGDNLKKVAKDLLKYDGAWKELWASNSVESKGSLDEGTVLRYWDHDGGSLAGKNSSATPPASTEVVQSAPPAEAAPSPEMPPAPPPPQAEAVQPPPEAPPAQDPAQEVAATPPPQAEPPPPPPMNEMAMNTPPPAPPSQPEVPAEPGAEAGVSGEATDDEMMMIGLGGVIAVAVVSLVVIRKRRRQKELEQTLSDTQVS